MKKKVLIMGKVYDFGKIPCNNIKQDIERRILEYTDKAFPVLLNVNEADKEINISIIRGLSADILGKDNKILEEDTLLLTGEGYEGYYPRYSVVDFLPHFPNMLNYFDIEDFVKTYAKNIAYEKASRVKSIDITPSEHFLTIKFKY